MMMTAMMLMIRRILPVLNLRDSTFPAKHLPVELACHRTANRFKLDERLTAVTKVKTKINSREAVNVGCDRTCIRVTTERLQPLPSLNYRGNSM